MAFNFVVPSPLQYFSSLVHSDEHFPLLEAAASLAQDDYPEMDVQQVLGDVDQLLARVKRRLPADASPLQKLRLLNQFFFQDLGFGGNVNDYYDVALKQARLAKLAKAGGDFRLWAALPWPT